MEFYFGLYEPLVLLVSVPAMGMKTLPQFNSKVIMKHWADWWLGTTVLSTSCSSRHSSEAFIVFTVNCCHITVFCSVLHYVYATFYYVLLGPCMKHYSVFLYQRLHINNIHQITVCLSKLTWIRTVRLFVRKLDGDVHYFSGAENRCYLAGKQEVSSDPMCPRTLRRCCFINRIIQLCFRQ